MAGSLLFLVSFSLLNKRVTMQVNGITNYLEQVNRGSGGVLGQVGEGAFSRLQDELYKTVTALRQTKDTALAARNNFAENLYNIAHQLKTPITAISLSVQMLRSEMTGEGTEAGHLARIAGQLARLTRLEEALLLLSRIDAGTLTLEKRKSTFSPCLCCLPKICRSFFGRKISRWRYRKRAGHAFWRIWSGPWRP